ncbi:tRNA (adenosine(37)-N6)-threonylcarbamoyltransferase complex ATPase subunit type 1 TsaE [Candidatus Dependentiae bacterium HGW-Dependentiae-1]|nr:MAG: tRNA (adenosine(37)-N6)-threonylcarbamoyltransferase complex ATPase subunit type 1 TsaE [Candidatus Dependentiae bacterium HGW-Dependentiae-1]
METEKILFTLEEVLSVAKKLKEQLEKHAVITFEGPLGAGKTTLVRTLLALMDVHGPITSPTFTYINQYENQRGQTFYHFDCYRLASLNDFLAAGFDEYLYQPNSWTFIEWPEIVLPLLTHNVCHVTLDYHGDKRSISWKTTGPLR